MLILLLEILKLVVVVVLLIDLLLYAVLFFAFELEIFDLVFHESGKAQLAPIGALFANRTLDILSLVEVHDVVGVLRHIVGDANISVDLINANFTEYF